MSKVSYIYFKPNSYSKNLIGLIWFEEGFPMEVRHNHKLIDALTDSYEWSSSDKEWFKRAILTNETISKLEEQDDPVTEYYWNNVNNKGFYVWDKTEIISIEYSKENFNNLWKKIFNI
jgi:hypothetical protein